MWTMIHPPETQKKAVFYMVVRLVDIIYDLILISLVKLTGQIISLFNAANATLVLFYIYEYIILDGFMNREIENCNYMLFFFSGSEGLSIHKIFKGLLYQSVSQQETDGIHKLG